MNGYIALYRAQRYELHSATSYDAWKQAVKHFKAPESKAHLVTVHLVENEAGEQVTTVITS
jgi:hypothetical protein